MKPDLADHISKEEALSRIFSNWKPGTEYETISVEEAAGRILASDQFARCNIPVVRASTMDGIAVKSERFSKGTPDTSKWELGVDYVRADTGDDFDDAFDAVIAIEDVTFLEGGGIALPENVNVKAGSNVKPSGADVKEDSLLVKKGTRLQGRDLAAIAMGGVARIPVVKKPRVAFLPTGSELVPPGQPLKRGENYETNGIMIRQMLIDMGAEPILHPAVPDEPETIGLALGKMLSQADIVLVGGGTSRGSEDYSFRLLEQKGKSLFHGVKAVPGRPMSAAVFGEKLVLNISGPAFAAFHSMEWMVRTLVCRWLDVPLPQRERVMAALTEPFHAPPVLSLMAAFHVEETEEGTYKATPLALRGPKSKGAASALTANGIYITSVGETSREAGAWIEIELLRDRGSL